MVRHIALDFLTDRRQYQRAQRYWRDLWQGLVGEMGVAKEWRSPWLAAPLANGDPMFSAVSTVLGRGVHVIQHAPTSDALELETWVDPFGEDGKDDVIDQLVISCALSDEAAAEARRLMRSWIVSGKLRDSPRAKTGDGKRATRAGGARPKGRRGRRAS